MEQLVQCPVCTLFLHNGMSLESHLDTHPKDQVIKALCSLSVNNASFGSRTSTPMHSERSYRSRSRTPAEDSPRWSGSHRSVDNDRYWRRTPSRTPKTPVSNITRNATPSDVRMAEINFESNSNNASSNHYSGTPFSMKSDKIPQPFIQNGPVPDFDQQYIYYPEQQEDKEIKYSRSAEYSAIDNTNNVFTYNMPPMAPGVKLQTALMPSGSRRNNELVKLLPKPNNILVKANMGGVQYITPGVKPVHLMVPTTPTFVQKNVQNNMIMTGSIPTSQILDTKSVSSPLSTSNSPFNQLASGAFTPSTTVVTQNSQIIYREMVHNLDGKPFISSMPAVLSGHDNVTNVAQTSMYQNVMVVDQFGNTSCMYTTPQQILSKPCNAPIYGDVSLSNLDKPLQNMVNDSNKTLIIEVSPIVTPAPMDVCNAATSQASQTTSSVPIPTSISEKLIERNDSRNDIPGPTKGLKILSNIKVEVPVQHHKNLLNTVVDLTGPQEPDFHDRSASPERILPDFEDNNQSLSGECTQPSTSSNDSVVSNTFSVIKNVGNPPSYKDSISKSVVDSKIDNDFSDSCPVPDLICNEKPSISPCSELSENGDNSTDRISISPKPGMAPAAVEPVIEKPSPQKPHRNIPLRLNNIFVKKHKKILEIKNSKAFSLSAPCSSTDIQVGPSPPRSPENFTMNKIHSLEKSDRDKAAPLQTVTVELISENEDHHEFDADTEEQSMDIEPVAHSSISHSGQYAGINMVQVKEEINSSNEGGFSNGTGASDRDLTPLESMRPINVISYGNMAADDFDDESNHKELLDLEAASKNKQFVSMMNENYFGDNIYADYFTPDRVESFDAVRESAAFSKEGAKDGMYIWGEPSQKEAEFVLPTFIHESYKIAESSGVDYGDMGGSERVDGEGEGCERDSKADVLSESRSEGEAPLNICADERMPARGELSGQESNGDMESAWSGMYTEVTPAEPYDLIARESWVSDGSEIDTNEKRENLEEDIQLAKPRLYTCSHCRAKFTTLKEMRSHKALAHSHVQPTCSNGTYSRLVTARSIKKEEKPDDILPGTMLMQDSKEAIATALQDFDSITESKPKIETLIKQEPKRKRKDFVCPTCKVDQFTEPAFHAHLQLHPLECLTCGKCFFKRANLALHMKTHLGIKNFKCEVCEKRFITRQKLMEHHNTHTGRAPVKCTLCDDSFKRYSNMVQHRDRHHLNKKTKIRDYVCHCGSVFHSRAKLRWHKETHDDKPKACLHCSDKFVHSSSLTRHVRRTHNEYYMDEKYKGKAENVPCPVCKQVYLRTNLRAHLLTHSGKRPYVCIICNKAFTTKWNLKLHRWTHMSRSAKPYKCNLCKGAFIRQTEYISHMNAHKSVRPYTCNYCGCQFIRKYNCQRHVREHEMAKKYVCKVPECGKSFHRSYYLSEHMKVHSGARPFSCNICGKMSSNKSNHNKHVKIHHAREPVATEA